MNPSEEAEHSKKAQEEQNMENIVSEVLVYLHKFPCGSISVWKTSVWSSKLDMLTLDAVFILYLLAM